jgi:hypothetical protein
MSITTPIEYTHDSLTYTQFSGKEYEKHDLKFILELESYLLREYMYELLLGHDSKNRQFALRQLQKYLKKTDIEEIYKLIQIAKHDKDEIVKSITLKFLKNINTT